MSLYVRRFGFGRPTSPDFPGESPGIVWSNLNDSALASVSMGYQIGVTPLQMVAAASAVANGGTLYEPRVVRAIDQGRRAHGGQAERGAHGDQDADTAATLTTIMEEVVERGTATRAQDRRLHRRRQDRHRRQAGQRPLLERAAERVVRRLRAVAESGAGDHRDDRLAARRRRHRRRGRGADLPAHCRRRAAPPGRAADGQPVAAGASCRAAPLVAPFAPAQPVVVPVRNIGGDLTPAVTSLPDLRGYERARSGPRAGPPRAHAARPRPRHRRRSGTGCRARRSSRARRARSSSIAIRTPRSFPGCRSDSWAMYSALRRQAMRRASSGADAARSVTGIAYDSRARTARAQSSSRCAARRPMARPSRPRPRPAERWRSSPRPRRRPA